MDLFRESVAGQLIYYASRKKTLYYPEEDPTWSVPSRYFSRTASEKPPPAPRSPPPVRHQASAISALSGQSANDRYYTPREEFDGQLYPGREDSRSLQALQDDRHSHGISPSSSATAIQDDNVRGGKELTKGGKVRAGLTEVDQEYEEEVRSSDGALNRADDPNLVDWYGPDDPDNPRNWSTFKKCFVTFDLCFLTFSIYMGSSIVTPSIPALAEYFHVSTVVATLALTVFVVGYGVGPMFLAPLSEIPAIGRNFPYIITLLIFVGLQPAVATAKNPATYFVLRFLSGFFGSPGLATGGASIGDMFEPKKRAYGIGIWGIAAVCGPTLGPLIGGFAYDALGWRWTIWPLLFLSSASLVFLTFLMPETSSSNILLRRARRLRKRTGNPNLYTTGEIMQRNMSGREILVMTFVRPFALNFEPIVGLLNLYIGFVYSLLYTFLTAFPLVFDDIYGFNSGQEGLAFFGLFVGALLTYAGFCLYARYSLEPLFVRKGGMIDPEDRLIPAMYGCWAIPVCLFGFGWTSTHAVPWIVPIIFSSFFSIGTFLLFQSILNYEGDAYPDYAASVLAGNDLARSIMAAAFPLFAVQMFQNLEKNGPKAFPVAWGCVLLGCIGIVLCPLPFIFYRYGAGIRKYSKYATNEPRMEGEMAPGGA
ncbi:MFS general substrate transporter [Dichomitus squalens]|nr:MFS general substrate transporter [Dichomitus squalens]